ncbi:MAG: pectate lyase, partial [Verrucomicrobiota bacterium]|nr:pectate lyase [Verrucomicrobiota bacterium]
MGLVYDAKIGQYKDLSYDALSEKGLTWKARAQLFGGDTVHYESLTDRQRIEKQKELKELLLAIKIRETNNWADPGLADRVEAEILNWLDTQVADVPKKYAEADIYPLRAGAVVYFRAYEIFGNKKYLEAGLNRADVILKAQWPRGHWPWGTRLGENFVRIQDGFNNEPFWIMLYAYKLSGDKKYYESAKRCADVLLSLQRMNGGWPDQWSFNGKSSGHSGVMNGVSFNDNATNSCVQMMVAMFHMTGDKKYIARLTLLGEFVEKSKMGEGDVTGWCEQYNDDGSPTRARQYE